MSCAYAFRGFDVRKSLILREPHAQKAEKLSKSGATSPWCTQLSPSALGSPSRTALKADRGRL